MGNNSALNFSDNCFWRLRTPVVGCNRPHHRSHAQSARGLQHIRASPAERRPKQRRWCAYGLFEDIAAILQLLPHLFYRDKNEVGIGVRVVANHMARSMDGANNIGALANEFADQEKRALDV